MNAISLVMTGQTAVELSLLQDRRGPSMTALAARFTPPASPKLGPRRPSHKRQISRDSPGWYNTDGGMTLDDFATRLTTRISRFEQWQGRCAQSVVMALMRPTPVTLFLLNPVSILLWAVLILSWWYSGEGKYSPWHRG